MLERMVLEEAPGKKIFPIPRIVVSRAIAEINTDLGVTHIQDYLSTSRHNPTLLGLTEMAACLSPLYDIDLCLYSDGIYRAHRIIKKQADSGNLVIPKPSTRFIEANLFTKLINDYQSRYSDGITDLEDLFEDLGDDLVSDDERNMAFVDGIRDFTQMPFYGAPFGLGAIDTFRYMQTFLTGIGYIQLNLN